MASNLSYHIDKGEADRTTLHPALFVWLLAVAPLTVNLMRPEVFPILAIALFHLGVMKSTPAFLRLCWFLLYHRKLGEDLGDSGQQVLFMMVSQRHLHS